MLTRLKDKQICFNSNKKI